MLSYIDTNLNKGGFPMVIDMLAQCRKRKKEIEDKFYTMVAYSDDIPALEKLSDEMIEMELMIIRMEKQQFDRLHNTEYAV